jgi:hypothetical protein
MTELETIEKLCIKVENMLRTGESDSDILSHTAQELGMPFSDFFSNIESMSEDENFDDSKLYLLKKLAELQTVQTTILTS